jgi:hypothetical protein
VQKLNETYLAGLWAFSMHCFSEWLLIWRAANNTVFLLFDAAAAAVVSEKTAEKRRKNWNKNKWPWLKGGKSEWLKGFSASDLLTRS